MLQSRSSTPASSGWKNNTDHHQTTGAMMPTELELKQAGDILQLKADNRFLMSKKHILESYYETEKDMRKHAEAQNKKFIKIIGRIYWRSK
jgi:RNA-binding protein YlmH